MTVLLIIAAVVVCAFLAFRFVRGMIKFALLAVVLLVAYLVAHNSGAF